MIFNVGIEITIKIIITNRILQRYLILNFLEHFKLCSYSNEKGNKK